MDAKPGAHVMLAVSDTGIGMDRNTLARVFEPFFTTKPKGQGTGLGLATVYGIVRQSSGHISVHSEPGEGTTFQIYLPRVDLPLEPSSTFLRAVKAGGTETILVVEDEDALRRFVCEILRSDGYTVLDVADGAAALNLYRRHGQPIHLLLTDVIMPGLNGRELAEALLRLDPKLKVLYTSGYTENAIAQGGVLDSTIAFLAKPIIAADLRRKVREVLDGQPRK